MTSVRFEETPENYLQSWTLLMRSRSIEPGFTRFNDSVDHIAGICNALESALFSAAPQSWGNMLSVFNSSVYVTTQQLKLQRGRALIGYSAIGRKKRVEGEIQA